MAAELLDVEKSIVFRAEKRAVNPRDVAEFFAAKDEAERLAGVRATTGAESPAAHPKIWTTIRPPQNPVPSGGFERVSARVIDESWVRKYLEVDPAAIAAWEAKKRAREEEARRQREEAERQYQLWLNTPIDWWWHNITFDNGVPVGGWARLKLSRGGLFEFAGHFHNSGAPSYDLRLVWVVTTPTHAFTFEKEGHMAGTFQSGSRDFDWMDVGTNADVASHWEDIRNYGGWNGRASVDLDVGALIGSAIQAIGYVVTVIKIVG